MRLRANATARVWITLALLGATLAARAEEPAGWGYFGGTSGGTRYSGARQIDRSNVGKLEVAWRYSTGELARRSPELIANSSTQTTPVLVDGNLIFCTPFNRVIALDPATGKERWTHDPKVALDHTLPFLSSAQKPRALVLGAGGLGQYGLQFIKLRSDAEVVVVDASPDTRRIALELGADHAVAPGEAEGLFTAVVDFVGADATLEAAAAHVARQGIAVVVGLYGGSIPFGFGRVPHEARFMSSIWGTRDQLGELVTLAQQHTLHSTIEVIGLADAQNAHERLHAGDVSGRFVIVPGNTA